MMSINLVKQATLSLEFENGEKDTIKLRPAYFPEIKKEIEEIEPKDGYRQYRPTNQMTIILKGTKVP